MESARNWSMTPDGCASAVRAGRVGAVRASSGALVDSVSAGSRFGGERVG